MTGFPLSMVASFSAGERGACGASWLARLPRKFKLAVVGGAFALALLFGLLPYAMRGTSDQIEKIAVGTEQGGAEVGAGGHHAGQDSARSSSYSFDPRAEALNAQDDHSIHLTPAPDPTVTEDTPLGSLPRISENGRYPWQVYARPFNTFDRRPRVAIIVGDIGSSRVSSDMAIARLPTNVTLAFDALSPVAAAWCARARQEGHEALLQVPMEPFDYPRSDPGPDTLLTHLPNTDNLQRLARALRQGSGYVGVTTLTGSKFTSDPEKLKPILTELQRRGLLVFDAHLTPHSVVEDLARGMRLPVVVNTSRIDVDLAPDQIDESLMQLEKTAKLTGRAVGIVAPLPIVIERLQLWLKDLPSRGVALAPISAMVE
ncbi:MAG: divergent polysaccharide deacetylase family protein [Bdellovibrionales bacterium]